jgi:hypothetical protein
LTEDHRGLVNNAAVSLAITLNLTVRVLVFGFGHFEPEVVPFTGSLSNTSKHRHAGCFNRNVSNEFLNRNRLSKTSTTEETDLSTLVERNQKVNNLKSGYKEFDLNRLVGEGWRSPVNRESWSGGDCCGLLGSGFWSSSVLSGFENVDWVTEKVENSSEGRFSNWNHNRTSSIFSGHSANQTVGACKGNATNDVIAKVLGDFAGEVDVALFVNDLDRAIDGWETFR